MAIVHGKVEGRGSRNRANCGSGSPPAHPDAGAHIVQYYESQSAILEKLCAFVGSALGAGGSAIVVVTPEHRLALTDRMREWGIDLGQMAQANRFIALDAEQCLGWFMVEGWPNRDRFLRAIEPEIVRARGGAPGENATIAMFGEMVVLLWERGHYEAALQLERLWNEVVQRHRIELLCGYPLSCFAHQNQLDLFTEVCREHSQVLPAESYTSLGDEAERQKMVSELQQRATTIRSVVQEREIAIAQRDYAQDKLWQSEELTRRVVEGGIDCVKVLDLSGGLIYMSPSGLAALEIGDPKSVLGRNWVDFWKEEDRPRAREALAAARSGSIGTFHGDCAATNGSRRWWDVRIAPARGRDGKVERLIAISRDMTELRQAQQIAIQAEKLAAAGRMAATIAHEINNPLEAVTNFIYLARTTPGMPEEAARHLEIADRELTRVAQIAQKTLGFYRDTSKSKWVGVKELVGDVVQIYDRKLRGKHLDYHVTVDPALKLFAKTGELKQALSNLIANAIDASSDGGEIWIRAHASLNWTNGREPGIRFSVADNGSGMSEEVQKRIFVPFFTTKANVGTGIGLWVTRSLIEQQGGYLHFRSSQGAHPGTVMSFFVPTQSDHVSG